MSPVPMPAPSCPKHSQTSSVHPKTPLCRTAQGAATETRGPWNRDSPSAGPRVTPKTSPRVAHELHTATATAPAPLPQPRLRSPGPAPNLGQLVLGRVLLLDLVLQRHVDLVLQLLHLLGLGQPGPICRGRRVSTARALPGTLPGLLLFNPPAPWGGSGDNDTAGWPLCTPGGTRLLLSPGLAEASCVFSEAFFFPNLLSWE